MSGTGTSVPAAKDASKSNRDRRNLDVALRNGLAGGVAGCAVSLTILPTTPTMDY